MFRRRFLQLATLASVGGLASLEVMAAEKGQTAILHVKGFSCITCAVGLDTMYSRTKGILSSHSTYPEGRVTVRFDPGSIGAEDIRKKLIAKHDGGIRIGVQMLPQPGQGKLHICAPSALGTLTVLRGPVRLAANLHPPRARCARAGEAGLRSLAGFRLIGSILHRAWEYQAPG